MRFDEKKTRANVQAASTDDLLDRVTIWRDQMEPEAVRLIESELRERGVKSSDLEAHVTRRAGEVIYDRSGVPIGCYHCEQPAVATAIVWGKFWQLLPLFPRRVYVCRQHMPGGASPA